MSRVWFVEFAGQSYIAASESTLKVGDIGRDPRVSFAVEGLHRAFTAEAKIVGIEDVPEVLRLFGEEYDGWDAADPTVDGPRVLIVLASQVGSEGRAG
jgi:hypothetical protein